MVQGSLQEGVAVGTRDGRSSPYPEATPDRTVDRVRGILSRFLQSRRTERLITAVIVVNAVALGLETSAWAMARAGGLLVAVDTLCLGVFVVEILAKLLAYRGRFFRSGWNIFDFVIVAIALVPASGPLSVLRALRILRVLRLLSVVPQMRRVVTALLTAIPGMTSIIAVLGLIFYVGAVMATKIFGGHPDPQIQEWFGTIGRSAYSLFQIMTLESWSMGIVRPVMAEYPWAWAFFVPFIVVTSFAVLNLFIAIVVNAMQSQHEAEHAATEAAAHDERTEILTEIRALRVEVTRLRDGRDG